MANAKLFFAASLAALLAGASGASAQTLPGAPAADTGDKSDTITVGLGAGYRPTYEGSDDYRISPAAIVRGRVSGFSFWSRGTSLYLDLIPDSGGDVDFSAGPVAGVRLNRTGGIKDRRVKRLGDLNTAYEVGGFVGIAKTGVITSEYDNIGVRVSYVKDVGNAHESHIITPAIEYGTPLDTKTFVGVGISADFVGDGYASYYFDVSPAGSVASGLPVYRAKGGFKSWGVNALVARALTGDLRGGLSVALIGSYTRLRNDFRRSPITSVRGSPNQWFGAIGLAYTF